MKNILFVSSEAHPLIKTGGLADVAGSLPIALSELGQDVRILIPKYQVLKLENDVEYRCTIRTDNRDVNIFETRLPNSDVIVWLVDCPEYFDMPVRTYSSGMYVRLAMSLFLHLEPEVFIIDEALSVGDIFFVQKCFSKIEEMRKNGVSFLFVSHDINLVQTISDKVLLLNKLAVVRMLLIDCLYTIHEER